MRRKRGLPPSYLFWWFLIFIFWIFILLRVLPSFIKATRCLISEKKELKKIESAKEQLERECKEQEEYVNRLKQGKGLEEELRKRGFVKQGEILVQIEGELPQPPDKKETPLQKLLHWLEKKADKDKR